VLSVAFWEVATKDLTIRGCIDNIGVHLSHFHAIDPHGGFSHACMGEIGPLPGRDLILRQNIHGVVIGHGSLSSGSLTKSCDE
jgi:hypothetical protein